MPDRYSIVFDGPLTFITEHPDGPWPRWEMARLAAIVHLEEQVRECLRTLQVLGRAGNFFEYELLVGEMRAEDVAQVVEGGTLR